jgi:hypothetical protein
MPRRPAPTAFPPRSRSTTYLGSTASSRPPGERWRRGQRQHRCSQRHRPMFASVHGCRRAVFGRPAEHRSGRPLPGAASTRMARPSPTTTTAWAPSMPKSRLPRRAAAWCTSPCPISMSGTGAYSINAFPRDRERDRHLRRRQACRRCGQRPDLWSWRQRHADQWRRQRFVGRRRRHRHHASTAALPSRYDLGVPGAGVGGTATLPAARVSDLLYDVERLHFADHNRGNRHRLAMPARPPRSWGRCSAPPTVHNQYLCRHCARFARSVACPTKSLMQLALDVRLGAGGRPPGGGAVCSTPMWSAAHPLPDALASLHRPAR